MASTLKDQIKEIHEIALGKDLHALRGRQIPMMVYDLVFYYFDRMVRVADGLGNFWVHEDTRDLRAVKHARKLLETCSLRESTPAVE